MKGSAQPSLPYLVTHSKIHQNVGYNLLGKRKKTRRVRFAVQVRKNPCFRAFIFFLIIQTLILFLVVLFVGDDFPQAVSSRAQTLLNVRDYYMDRFRHRLIPGNSVQPGIVIDDDAASQNPQDMTEAVRDDDVHDLEDHIANQTEARLNQEEQDLLQGEGSESVRDSVDDSASPQISIDNYYARQSRFQQGRKEENPFPFLIVGGSDGSGTRAFVTALGKLGVPMIVDDRGTLDIHGAQLFNKKGWPPLVQLVLNHTHSANYKVEDVPEDVRTIIIKELNKLQEDLVKRGLKYDNDVLKKQKRKLNHYPDKYRPPQLRHPVSAFEQNRRVQRVLVEVDPGHSMEQAVNKSKLVQFGWKAPVSMLLLPFLREVFGPIKFIHVVRDGRDVALSANQSPVKKFYNSYYSNPGDIQEDLTKVTNDTAMNIRAMHLWNDWNIQVLEYEKTNVGKDFDFMVMRTEDLLDPEKKFQSLQQLAHFVGSRKSMNDLCCQSQEAVVDMGQSSPNMGDGRRRVPVGRKKIYDRLFPHESKTDWTHWYGSRGAHHKDEHLISQIKSVLASAGSRQTIVDEAPTDKDHLHHHPSHGVMGADPVLGYIHGRHDNGLWNSYTFFDTEKGRHANWHHGLMQAEPLVEVAKERRLEDLRRRNERYRGLAARVADVKRKKTGRQKPFPLDPMHGFAAHHEKQKQMQKAMMNGFDPKTPHNMHEPIEGGLHGHHQQQAQHTHRVDHRRRLLSSFNKLQIRHNPYREKKLETTIEQRENHHGNDTAEKKAQFHDGEPEFSKQGREATEPIGGRPGSAWSLASSISQVLGLFSSPTASAMDREILEKFQSTPLQDILNAEAPDKSTRINISGRDAHGRKKSHSNVKARYGKWEKLLEDKPELSESLHVIASKGLAAFGYEPPRQFLDTSGIDRTFQCGSKVVCPHGGKKAQVPK